MITIKKLTEEDMSQAIDLKILCWTEELSGLAENTMSKTKQLQFWLNWMNTAEENEDIRLVIGAFENGEMLGVAIGSIAEPIDIPDKGIELNGLWVYPKHRNRGISLRLLNYLIDYYIDKGMESIVIYNIHHSPANKFYRKFGAKVLKQEYQMNNKLLIDVFGAQLLMLKENIEKSLLKYTM